MADEAFALSPISARAAMPSDADYDAIREAFMETSRGRWFLNEYAKRNRNADTRMVLDAVARIEQNLAAQKQQQASGTSLSESLIAIRAIVGEARASVARSIASLENDAVLTAARNGARVIREVSWTLRECGADVRICNLLDSQLGAIDIGHRLIAEIDTDAVLAAFDGLLDHIHDLAGEPRPRTVQPSPTRDEPESPAADGDLPEAATIAVAPARAAKVAAAAEVAAPEIATTSKASAAPETPNDPPLTIVTGTSTDEIEFVEAADHAAAQASPAVTASAAVPEPEAGQAEDEDSVLDLVALEMSAPQPHEPGELEAAIEAARIEAAQAAETHLEPGDPSEIAQLAAEVTAPHEPAEFEMSTDEPSADEVSMDTLDTASTELPNFEIGERGEPLYVPPQMVELVAAPTAVPVMTAAPSPVAGSTPATGASASLGAALLASGVVGHPGQSRGDALAPLRRMSQPEKIAFFS
ncbi:hypothetical protein NML43_08475 [Rhodopseudomonas palustris]|uniref:hypothetical protein n=1 Tax=Rhodopseudomonas palustris TaxID=1076 RepID=UPI0020CE62E3|nr:hypothetical protein [Rhodopseudomonas palustris]MCP9627117.1 hypothetical protein [Rhodopseudomonas palustris]